MNTSKYRLTFYGIIIVILAVIGIQSYWNYKNYLQNKQQLINEMRTSLDKAVDDYYNAIAEATTLGFAFNPHKINDSVNQKKMSHLIKQLNYATTTFSKIDTLKIEPSKDFMVMNRIGTDSSFKELVATKGIKGLQPGEVFNSIQVSDSVNDKFFKNLTSKVIISITRDSVSLDKIDNQLRKELKRKNIDLQYGLRFTGRDSLVQELNPKVIDDSQLLVQSNSTFLPKDSSLSLAFTNVSKLVLKRSFVGILISFLLVMAIISILFFMLKVIRDQKNLAEMKDDFISNITHEFKTPISTVGVAIESLKDFNTLDDKARTKNYLDMSQAQLRKLNVMVEKLLETASINTEKLQLNREQVDVAELLDNVVRNHKFNDSGKMIDLQLPDNNIKISVDVFHFENALSNLIDNAIKYGGNEIIIAAYHHYNQVIFSVFDNGSKLTKKQAEHIFDKFYRVNTGNTHDVKGFGIGLYYTKKIIEKHGGSIVVDLDNSGTKFKISIPNA